MGLFSKILKKKNPVDEHEKFLKSEYQTHNKKKKKSEEIVEFVDLKSRPNNETKVKSAPKEKKAIAAPKKASPEPNPKETSAQKTAKKGFFDIKKTKDNRYVFNLYASNSVIVATSQTYGSPQSALAGIKSVTVNAERAPIEDSTLKDFKKLSYPKWEIYKDKAGQFRFRLCASNGSCVCHSQGYAQKTSCKNGIASIIRTAKDATIDKTYLEK